MEPIISSENLSKWYGSILGISEINLRIPPGIYGLLGPNGAGKSTFLKILTGFLKPNLGKITVFGKNPAKNPAIFYKIGYCPEHDAHHPTLSGWEFILFRAQIFGLGHIEAAHAMQKVGLSEHMHKRINQFSLGMRQRLKLAAAFVHNPELLILDEPLRGIDPLWRIKIIRLIRELGQQGRTVIISSHILPEIEAMTRQIILIHQGKVFATGDIEEIRSLLDTHPHQICIKTDKPRELASFFLSDPSILGISFSKQDPTMITFTTHQRDQFYTNLLNSVITHQLDLLEMSSPDDNLQKVFDFLIGR
jgi:ABC-2 type transport system ATP-binding protein